MRRTVAQSSSRAANRRPRSRAAAAAAAADKQCKMMRRSALYCTPHMKIPGVLSASPSQLTFEPDDQDQHVIEVGVEQYKVVLEVRDILECGAVAMPVGDSTADANDLAFFLQLQVRTLDGQEFFSAEDEPMCVVFRLGEKEHLYEVATLLLDAIEDRRQASPSDSGPNLSSTRVPFPCLDCMAELEHVAHQQQLERQLSQDHEEASAQPSKSAPARLIGNLASFLTGPANQALQQEARSDAAENSPSSPPGRLLDKVSLRLPEHCERSLLTKELAECLLEYLPVGLRLPGVIDWVLRYTPKAHGVSLSTLFRNLAECEKTIVLIQDTEDCIFGGFATEAWMPCYKFFGSGEAFVFSFGTVHSTTEPPEQVQFFPWSSRNECFQYSDLDLFGMGGGDGSHAFAFMVREDLLNGHSSPTETFGNSRLSAKEEFVIRDIEVWSLEEAAFG